MDCWGMTQTQQSRLGQMFCLITQLCMSPDDRVQRSSKSWTPISHQSPTQLYSKRTNEKKHTYKETNSGWMMDVMLMYRRWMDIRKSQSLFSVVTQWTSWSPSKLSWTSRHEVRNSVAETLRGVCVLPTCGSGYKPKKGTGFAVETDFVQQIQHPNNSKHPNRFNK